MHHGKAPRTFAWVMLALVVVGLAVASVPASGQGDVTATPKNGFDEFSRSAVRIRLEDFFQGGRTLNDELAYQGVVFDNASGGDFSSECPGQFDLVGGYEAGFFGREPVSFRFVEPATREPRVTNAVGVPVGSLFNNRGQGPFQATLTTFDVDGNVLGSVTSDAPPDTTPRSGDLASRIGVDFLGLETPGIHRVVLANESSPANPVDGFVVGDFFYSAPPSACSFGPDLVFEPLAPPTPRNRPPIAVGDAFRTDEDRPLTAPAPGVLAKDSDPDEDALTASLVDGPAEGTLSLNPDGSFTYTPIPDASGQITFTYQASDGTTESEPGTVTITITPVNDGPVATGDAAATVVNARVDVAVTSNDSDVEGDTLTATPVSVPAHGIATCSGGSCTYAPEADFTGPDAFTYVVSDGRGGSDRARVGITVVPLGTPEAADDLVATAEDTEVRVDVLANDVLGDQPTAVTSRPPARGTLLGGEGGSFTYRPAPDDNRDEEFTYTITDADGQRSNARVRISITPVNDPPSVPPGGTFSTGQNQPLAVGAGALLAGVVDADGDQLRAVLANDPAHGFVDLRPAGSFTYTPDPGYAGPDVFTYRASDGTATSGEARVVLDVTAVRGATEERPAPAGAADPAPPPPPASPGGEAPPGAPVPPPPAAGSQEGVTLQAVSAAGVASGPPGVALEITGSGYGDCETVFFFLDDVRIGADQPDEQGDVRQAGLSIPGDARTGTQALASSCDSSGRPTAGTTSFEVTGARLHRNAIATSLHRPDQIPLDLRSIALSSAAALSLLLLIAFPSELFNKTLEENYDEIRGWFGFTQPIVRATRRWPPYLAAGIFFIVAAVLYSALDPGFGLNLTSLITVVAALVSLAGVVVLYDLPALAYMRVRHGETGRLQVLPGTILVAVPCVLISRLLGFQPGYIYGLVAFFAFRRLLRRETEGRLYATQALFLLVSGLVAWLVWAPTARSAAQPDPSFWILLAEAVLAALFVASLETATFALMPFRFLDGNKVVRWSRIAWTAVFALSTFLFLHILLRPGSGYVGRTANGSTLIVEALFVGFAALSVMFWAYFRFRRQPTVASARGSGSAGT